MINRKCRGLLGVLPAMVMIAIPAGAASRLDPDKPLRLEGVEAVCTGIGSEARQDPRWQAYPLKVEVAGKGGQYLGDVTLSVHQDGKELAAVQCDGPWTLFRVPPGRYEIEAQTEGRTAKSGAFVPATGQGRIILRFPDTGGQITAPAPDKRLSE